MGLSRFMLYTYFFTLPGLSSYPPVRIADRNAKQTPIIRISFMDVPPVKSLVLHIVYPKLVENEMTVGENCVILSTTHTCSLVKVEITMYNYHNENRRSELH